jgi:hypothetical protein
MKLFHYPEPQIVFAGRTKAASVRKLEDRDRFQHGSETNCFVGINILWYHIFSEPISELFYNASSQRPGHTGKFGA